MLGLFQNPLAKISMNELHAALACDFDFKTKSIYCTLAVSVANLPSMNDDKSPSNSLVVLSDPETNSNISCTELHLGNNNADFHVRLKVPGDISNFKLSVYHLDVEQFTFQECGSLLMDRNELLTMKPEIYKQYPLELTEICRDIRKQHPEEDSEDVVTISICCNTKYIDQIMFN